MSWRSSTSSNADKVRLLTTSTTMLKSLSRRAPTAATDAQSGQRESRELLRGGCVVRAPVCAHNQDSPNPSGKAQSFAFTSHKLQRRDFLRPTLNEWNGLLVRETPSPVSGTGTLKPGTTASRASTSTDVPADASLTNAMSKSRDKVRDWVCLLVAGAETLALSGRGARGVRGPARCSHEQHRPLSDDLVLTGDAGAGTGAGRSKVHVRCWAVSRAPARPQLRT